MARLNLTNNLCVLAIRETLVVDSSRRLVVPLPDSVPAGTRVVVSVTEELVAVEHSTQEPDPVPDIVGAFAGEPGPTGRHAEDILYGHGDESSGSRRRP